MSGGKHSKLDGSINNKIYYIDDNGFCSWDFIGYEEIDKYEIFTLEEFLEKYPFKVGDKVMDGYGDTLTIKSMSWSADFETMVYDFEDSAIVLAADDIKFADDDKLSGTVDNSTEAKSCTVSLKAIEDSIDSVQFVQSGKIVAVRFNTQNYENEVELQLDDYEIKIRDGKTYAVRKKPAYPKTYEECCKVLKKNPDIKPEVRMVSPEESLLFFKFIMLKRCRDAYWEIAGEEMGLDGPWEPAVQNTISGITRSKDEVEKYSCRYGKTRLLEFPTIKMRDVFFENFKDLIERCKELL
jgi:hypothetical protein